MLRVCYSFEVDKRILLSVHSIQLAQRDLQRCKEKEKDLCDQLKATRAGLALPMYYSKVFKLPSGAAISFEVPTEDLLAHQISALRRHINKQANQLGRRKDDLCQLIHKQFMLTKNKNHSIEGFQPTAFVRGEQ